MSATGGEFNVGLQRQWTTSGLGYNRGQNDADMTNYTTISCILIAFLQPRETKHEYPFPVLESSDGRIFLHVTCVCKHPTEEHARDSDDAR